MKIIDLSQPIYNKMLVYPGDPEVKIELIHIASHTGTHVDAFSHMDEKGQTLDQMPLSKFIGKAVMVKSKNKFPVKIGLAFSHEKLELNLYSKIKAAKAPFILVDKDCDFPVPLERKLLQGQIVTFTDLVNLNKLPLGKKFMFYGLPLKIKDGDGSPIRAVAVL